MVMVTLKRSGGTKEEKRMLEEKKVRLSVIGGVGVYGWSKSESVWTERGSVWSED